MLVMDRRLYFFQKFRSIRILQVVTVEPYIYGMRSLLIIPQCIILIQQGVVVVLSPYPLVHILLSLIVRW